MWNIIQRDAVHENYSPVVLYDAKLSFSYLGKNIDWGDGEQNAEVDIWN
jgi:hypothetical protein